MGLYTKNALYNSYDRKNKEREANDYYSTPTEEVTNILETLSIDFSNKTILEPCVGGGHMAEGINEYIAAHNFSNVTLLGSDIQDRGYKDEKWQLKYGKNYDFFSDDYPYSNADILIMNPPYSCIEGFMIRALEIASIVIMLGRTQVLEGQGRYDNVYKNNPPSEIYQYVDRIKCYKNGEKDNTSSAQAYCWIVWRQEEVKEEPTLKWIFRKN